MNDWKNYITLERKSEAEQHPHCTEEKAHLFSSFSGGSTEIETLDLIHSLIRIQKPLYILETGAYRGVGTIALGTALFENGFGKLISVEKDKECYQDVKEKIKSLGLENFVILLNEDSIDFTKNNDLVYDFAFFDSDNSIRPQEFLNLYKRGNLSNIVAFHDTSRLREKSFLIEGQNHKKYVQALDEIEKKYCKGSLEFFLSRGLRVMQVQNSISSKYKLPDTNK